MNAQPLSAAREFSDEPASFVKLNGIDCVGNLMWPAFTDEKISSLRITLEGQKYGATSYVKMGEQIGYFNGEEANGLVSAAALVFKALNNETESWTALIECDEGNYLIVSAAKGQLLVDGDQVFGERQVAVAQFEKSFERSWDHIYSTPGFAFEAEDFELDGIVLNEEQDFSLSARPFTSRATRRAGKITVFSLVFALLGWGAYDNREIILSPFKDKPVQKKVVQRPKKKEIINTVTDTIKFVERCDRQIKSHSSKLINWTVSKTACYTYGNSEEFPPVLQQHTSKPVLVVVWNSNGPLKPIRRILAEKQLTNTWPVAGVKEGQAKALQPLGFLRKQYEGGKTSFSGFRREIDTHIGPITKTLSYQSDQSPWRVEFSTGYPLVTLAERLRKVPALEVVAIENTGNQWRISGQYNSPVPVEAGQFYEELEADRGQS
ncbi:MAG: type 4b pilus protein PilO2 [Aestuariibacter sp.]|nr:type 4b pilus protein PilO2 [Aestuariibacter sp.]